LPIFCEKIGVFLKPMLRSNFFSKTSSSFGKKRQYFRQHLKIITSAPDFHPQIALQKLQIQIYPSFMDYKLGFYISH
jgi:hypothetical protein